MKVAISAVLLMLAIAAPGYAFQDPEKDKEKPPRQDEPRKQVEPRKQEPDRQQPPPSERQRPPQDRPQDKQPPRDNKQDQSDRSRQQQQDKQQQNDRQQQSDKQQQSERDRARQDRAAQERAAQDQRDSRARDERNRDNRDDQRTRDSHDNARPTERDHQNHSARRIPEPEFRERFGREHAFRVSRRDDRRFNYGGYWFVYNDAWPAEWSYDDDFYVDDIDGDYYLIDREHPGIRLYVVVGD